MIALFKKSKINAKKRLSDCVKNDRECVRKKRFEDLSEEIGEVIGKYAKTDGRTNVFVKGEYLVITAHFASMR